MKACKCMHISALYSVLYSIEKISFWPLEAEFEVLAQLCGHIPDRSDQESQHLFSCSFSPMTL